MRAVIHFSLITRDAGVVASLRQCMRAVIRERLQLRYGRHSVRSTDPQAALICMWCGRRHNGNKLRTFIIGKLATGSWEEPICFEHVCEPGRPRDAVR